MHYGNLKGGQHLMPIGYFRGEWAYFGNVKTGIVFMLGDNFFVKQEGRYARCANSGDDDVYHKNERYEFGDTVPVFLVEIDEEECGSCGCYHPTGYAGECRDDRYRFPDWDPNQWFDD